MFSNLTKEKIFFTQHLYLMLKGGFLVSDALDVLRKEIKCLATGKIHDGNLYGLLKSERKQKFK